MGPSGSAGFGCDGRELLERPQPGGLGAGVVGDLLGGRLAGAAVEQTDGAALGGAAGARHAGRARAAAPLGGQEPVLHDAILAGVVAQDDDAAARSEPLDGGVEGDRQDLELAVDLDAQRLEDPLGGMAAGAAGRCRDG